MSTSIIRINLVIITAGLIKMVHYLPCSTKFLRVIIFVIFPAHIFPAKNVSTENIFQLKLFSNLKVICYTGFTYSVGYTNCSIVWNFLHCMHFHCAYLIKRKILTMTGLGLSEITKSIPSKKNQSLLIAKFVPAKHKNCKLPQKHFMPHSMLEKLQGLRPYYLHNPCKNFLISLASKAPYSQLFTSNS